MIYPGSSRQRHTLPWPWLWPWIWQFLQPRLWPLIGVLALALVSTALGVLTPWITKHIIDDGLVAGHVPSLQGWVAAMLGVAVLSAVFGALNRRAYLAVSSDMLMRMRAEVFAHLGTLSPDFYLQWRQGDLISRLDGDIGEVQRFVVDGLLASINALLAVVAVLALMWWLSPMLTGIAFVLLPISIVFLRVMRPRLETQTRQMRERTTDISALLVDRLPNMLLLQSFHAVAGTSRVLDELQSHYREQLLRSQMLGYWVATAPALFNMLATAAVFILGGRAVITGALSLGTLIAFASYLARATGPVNTLLGVYVAFQRASVSLHRVRELLDVHSAVTVASVPEPLPPGGGSLGIVAMSYGIPPLWEPMSLELPAGSRVWVRGDSGVGKSTLLQLLQRHADPLSGSILLDGCELPSLALKELRGAITLLLQDAHILDASLRENLRLGTDVDDETLLATLHDAELNPWYQSLDAGLDTRMGNRGARLSGGERQRLALARAFLQHPRMLLLDETTSGMDQQLESGLWATIDRLFAVQTLIVVSHRQPPLVGLTHELLLAERIWTLRHRARDKPSA